MLTEPAEIAAVFFRGRILKNLIFACKHLSSFECKFYYLIWVMKKPWKETENNRNKGVFHICTKIVYTFPSLNLGFVSHKATKAQRNECFVPLCENSKSVNRAMKDAEIR